MLTALRRLAGTWFAKLLFGLLVLSFAGWGISDVITGLGRDGAVARVDGEPIPLEEAQGAVRRETARLSARFGPQFEADEGVRRAVAQRALEGLVADRALGREARRAGVGVTEAAVRDYVFRIPGLQGADGRPSPAILQAFLRANDLTEPQFLALVRADLARQQLVGAVRAGAAGPDALTRPLLAWAGERREGVLVRLPLADAPAPPAPTDAQLRRFHENTPGPFTAPETRRATVAALDPAMLVPEVAVPEADVAAAYEARRANYERAERRALLQVLVADEVAATGIAEAWRGGADDAAVVALAEAAGGQALPIGTVDRAGLPVAGLADAAFALAAGGVSAPVRTGFGWHVLKVGAIEPGSLVPLERVADELRQDLAREKAADLAFERANQVEDALAGGATLDEVGARFALRLAAVDTDAEGLGPDGAPVALPVPEPARADTLRTVFATAPGAAPRLVESVGSGFVAVSVAGVTPAALRPFAIVEAQVRAAWAADARRRSQEERAAGLLAAVKAGRDLAAAAAEAGLAAAPTGTFGRQPPAPEAGAPAAAGPVPAPLLEPLFAAAVGEATMAEVPAPDPGFAVAQLTAVRPADPAADPLGLGRVRDAVEQAMADDLEAQYAAALRARAGVTYNPALIGALTGSPAAPTGR